MSNVYSTTYDGGKQIYTIWNGKMEINPAWLFPKMSNIGCEICTYSYYENKIDLFGNYPKEKFIQLKKFFYDSFPYTSTIEARNYGLRIHFQIPVTIVNQDTFN